MEGIKCTFLGIQVDKSILEYLTDNKKSKIMPDFAIRKKCDILRFPHCSSKFQLSSTKNHLLHKGNDRYPYEPWWRWKSYFGTCR